MKNDKIVIINGKKYRMPSENETTNSSQTQQSPLKNTRRMDFVRSSHITHFGPKKVPNPSIAAKPVQPPARKINSDIAPTRHPLASRVDGIREQAKIMRAQISTIKPAQVIKNEAILEAMEKPVPVEKPEKKSFFKSKKKIFSIFGAACVLVLLLGFLMYINIPNLSVHIASARSGIDATFPEYKPDGYSLSGPVSYSDGEVTINFHANTGKTKFVIVQKKSAWDSTAVKNMVTKKADENTVVTTEERGLTIFTYNGNAAWVNGGILYTITGDAPLSNDQLRRIATSL
jgi:Domain of unknown function (DUF4367)